MWKNVEFSVIVDGIGGDSNPYGTLHGIAHKMEIDSDDSVYLVLWSGTTIKLPGTDVRKIEIGKTSHSKGTINFGFNATIYLYGEDPCEA